MAVKFAILIAFATLSFVSAQDVTGRLVASNCPPLEAQPQAQSQAASTGRICQWIITIDTQGCRRISQDCSSQPLCRNQNEVFWQCAQDCEPSCEGEGGRTCRTVCQSAKCQCAPSFLRTRSGQCVPRASCPAEQNPTPTCNFGEVLVRQNCSRLACERSCNGEMNCNRECNQLMCLCADGFFRNPNTRQCVASNQCQNNNPPRGCTRDSECGGNQICQNSRCANGCTSNNQCSQGLLCTSGRCTLPICNRDNDCPRGNVCTGNRCTAGCRAFSDCANGFVCVEGTCRQLANQPGQCTSDSHCGQNGICINFQCRLGCRNNNACAPGFGCFNNQCLRRCNSNFNCQSGTRCSNGFCVQGGGGNQCARNEVFRSCASACEPSCFQRNNVCTTQCLPGRCQCNNGFVRDRFGNCVSPNQCF
uniref:TIL domain-containing protein n=1 Tax=Panagrolaimus sp. ES5 TaxID=591445 RepID=A0AC34GQF9_9BILA